MKRWTWIECEVVQAIHDMQLAEHGGLEGVRDIKLLESALARPQNLASYGDPDAAALAAAYGWSVARNHPLVDGNERSAFVVTELFMQLNGYALTAEEFVANQDPRWLEDGRDPMITPQHVDEPMSHGHIQDQSERATVVHEPQHEYAASVRVPLLANSGSMGPGARLEQDDVVVGSLALSPQWLTRRVRPSSPAALRFIHAYGDSMHPTFEDGDILLVDTGRRDPSGADGVYVLATADRVFIKRVTARMNGGHDVTSDNPAVKIVQQLNGDGQIRVLGRVLWAWNGRKL